MAAPRKRKHLDALELLVDDHNRVRRIFGSFAAAERGDHAARRAIVERACDELKIHAALEAEILYPAARAALGPHEASIVNEAEIEHGAAADLIDGLERLEPDDPYYAATFAVLAEYAAHHMEAEQNVLFARLRDSSLDLHALAAQLRDRRSALLDAADTPGQVEPSAEAEGEYEPVLDETVARLLQR